MSGHSTAISTGTLSPASSQPSSKRRCSCNHNTFPPTSCKCARIKAFHTRATQRQIQRTLRIWMARTMFHHLSMTRGEASRCIHFAPCRFKIIDAMTVRLFDSNCSHLGCHDGYDPGAHFAVYFIIAFQLLNDEARRPK